MNNFDALPSEKIYEICESMDPISLINFVQTSKRNRDICSEILDSRMKIIDDQAQKDISYLFKSGSYNRIGYTKPYPPGELLKSSNIIIDTLMKITQYDYVDTSKLPKNGWIFGNNIPINIPINRPPYDSSVPISWNFIESSGNNRNDILKAIKIVLLNGYTRVMIGP